MLAITIVLKDLFILLQSSPAKGVLIASCSPTKALLAPESKKSFKLAPQGILDTGWLG